MAIKASDIREINREINRRNREFWENRNRREQESGDRGYSVREYIYGTSGRAGTSGSIGVSGSSGVSGVSRPPDMLREYLDLDASRVKKEEMKKENKPVEEKDKKPQKEIKHKRSIEF